MSHDVSEGSAEGVSRGAQPTVLWILHTLLSAVALTLAAGAARSRNVVLVIADDVSTEWFGAYGAQSYSPPTPTIDALATEGVLFRNAWPYPVCSPFRVSAFNTRGSTASGTGSTERADRRFKPRIRLEDRQLPAMSSSGAGAQAHPGSW